MSDRFQTVSMSRTAAVQSGQRRRLLLSVSLTLVLCLSLVACKRRGQPPTLVHVGEFALVDEQGQPFDQTHMDGKVWIAAFMFTRCPSICPRMMQYMRALQVEAKRTSTDIQLVSFSVDPENDSPEVLRAYAERFQVERSNWRFLTGDYKVIRETSMAGFKLALEGTANANRADFGILHSSYLVLVDRHRNVRGYYETSDPKTAERLLADARTLD